MKIEITAVFGIIGLALAATATPVEAGAQTLARPGDRAVTFCWKNSKDYYFCYGPTQRLQAGDKDIDVQLDYAGCDDADPQGYWGGSGVSNGVWYVCQGTKLYNYHNSPERIRSWVESHGG